MIAKAKEKLGEQADYLVAPFAEAVIERSRKPVTLGCIRLNIEARNAA